VQNPGFDIVIGNPPWGVKFTNNEKTNFKNRYRVAKGIIDSFALFIECGTKLLHSNGVLSMILPDIVLLKAYPATRKFILDNYIVTTAAFWGMAFDEVNLDSCTLIGTREVDSSKRNNNIINSSTTGFGINGSIVIDEQIPQKIFETNTDYKFNLFWNSISNDLLVKLRKNSNRFDELFHSHEGIHSGNIRNKLFVDKKLNGSCEPLIFGRDEIKPFRLTWNGKFVCYDTTIINKKNKEYANIGRRENFESIKILVRRTGDHVIAAVDRNQYFASNNLFICIPKEDIDLDYVAGVLNSNLITWYFRTIQPRVGRLFAELKLVHLNEFPIKSNSTELMKQIAKLSKTLSQPLTEEKRFDIINELNKAVYKIYDLNNSEIELIEKNSNDYTKVK